MKNFIFGLFILAFISSCSKDTDPSIEIIKGYSLYTTGSGQRGQAGEYLNDSLSVQIIAINSSPAGMRVDFSVLTGGGEVTKPITTVDVDGKAYTFWKTGTTSNQQRVKASIYSSQGELLSSTTFIANAFKPNAWDTVTMSPDNIMWDLATDTVSKYTLMNSCGLVYRQSVNYYDWELLNTNNFGSITAVKINSKSHAFVCNSMGDVMISRDKGNTWNQTTKPIPGSQEYTFLYISNNDYMWASSGEKNLVCSKDEGYTWQDASAGLSSGDQLGEIVKLKDGALLFRTTNSRLLKSVDDGLSWALVPMEIYSNSIFLTPTGDLLLYTMSMGKHKILKSTDNGVHFTELYSVGTNSATSKFNFFNYSKGIFYMMIPGKGIIRTTDLIHYEDYFNNTKMWNLFIDHNGVLIATAQNNTVFYRQEL